MARIIGIGLILFWLDNFSDYIVFYLHQADEAMLDSILKSVAEVVLITSVPASQPQTTTDAFGNIVSKTDYSENQVVMDTLGRMKDDTPLYIVRRVDFEKDKQKYLSANQLWFSIGSEHAVLEYGRYTADNTPIISARLSFNPHNQQGMDRTRINTWGDKSENSIQWARHIIKLVQDKLIKRDVPVENNIFHKYVTRRAEQWLNKNAPAFFMRWG